MRSGRGDAEGEYSAGLIRPLSLIPGERAAGLRAFTLALLAELDASPARDASPCPVDPGFVLQLIEQVLDNLARSLQEIDDATLPAAAIPWVTRQRLHYAKLEELLMRIHVTPLDWIRRRRVR